jgi:Transglycosylase-like domain
MRTRIALVAIIPIAIIVSTLTQAATVQSAGEAVTPSPGTRSASGSSPSATVVMPPSRSVAFHRVTVPHAASGRSSLLLDLNPALLNAALLAGRTGTASPAPKPAATTVVATSDPVTPSQRAAWERVAMCEEGGNWASDGARFSGGLGITRSNWSAYGGGAFAPEGAMATEDQQIMVAERIQANPPDQYGCGSW